MKSLLLALILSFSVQSVSAAGSIVERTSLTSGVISIQYPTIQGKLRKVTIAKGNEKYTYNLTNNASYPLQLGNGDYTITILEHVSGTSYKVLQREQVKLNTANTTSMYLISTPNILFDDKNAAVILAKELTKDATTSQEKAVILHDYIINNIQYDYNKAANTKSDYISSIDETLKTQIATCYDFATLYAAMLRSVNVPTKLLTGYKNDINAYHAWNQVYLAESNSWMTVDTSYDSQKLSYNNPFQMTKSETDYRVLKQY